MRITAKIDYAVRACVELAATEPGLRAPGTADGPRDPGAAAERPWVKAETVAERQGVPVPFVLSILSELRRAGIVESRRGAEGGYRLAHPASAVTVADVVRAIDGPLASVGGGYVEDVSYGGSATAVRDVWVALRAAMRTVLDATSLADVARGDLPGPVVALLADDGAWSTRPHGRSTRVGR